MLRLNQYSTAPYLQNIILLLRIPQIRVFILLLLVFILFQFFVQIIPTQYDIIFNLSGCESYDLLNIFLKRKVLNIYV